MTAYTAFIMVLPHLLLAAVPGLSIPLAEWQVTAGYLSLQSATLYSPWQAARHEDRSPGMAIIAPC